MTCQVGGTFLHVHTKHYSQQDTWDRCARVRDPNTAGRFVLSRTGGAGPALARRSVSPPPSPPSLEKLGGTPVRW
eukprot:scaffold163775_cov32-Tisochrysis_lutea.AAC.2